MASQSHSKRMTIMIRYTGLLFALCISACVVEPDNQTETTTTQDLAQDLRDTAVKDPPNDKDAACQLAVDKLAIQSCLAGSPISASGLIAALPTEPQATQACNTYYGGCTGINGCSRAIGEGWELTNCGTFLYSWMTICNGQPTSWGTGFCFF